MGAVYVWNDGVQALTYLACTVSVLMRYLLARDVLRVHSWLM